MQVSKMLRWAGLGFGEEESYLISLSLKKLFKTEEIKELRFWGKIYGSEKDYYIAMGTTTKKYKDDISPEWEPRGKGVNQYTFWVTHNVLESWVELPLISPDHVK